MEVSGGAGGYLKEAETPGAAHRFLAGPVTLGREKPTLHRSVPEGQHFVKGTHAGAVH